MRIFLIFLLMLVFAGTVFSQTTAKKLTEREKLILKINREVEDSTVTELLLKYNNDIRRSIKDKTPLSALKYSSFAFSIKLLTKYRWFIADTGLSRKWLKKCYELLAYMSKIQSYLEAAKFNGRTKTVQYKKALEYFNIAYRRFVKLIKKPVKVSGKIRRKAQAKKILWQRAMREKYKIRQKY